MKLIFFFVSFSLLFGNSNVFTSRDFECIYFCTLNFNWKYATIFAWKLKPYKCKCSKYTSHFCSHSFIRKHFFYSTIFCYLWVKVCVWIVKHKACLLWLLSTFMHFFSVTIDIFWTFFDHLSNIKLELRKNEMIRLVI